MSDEMLKEAISALRAGQRLRAKDLLTRLIKVEQGNADYWLWMSAAVDTEKEQIYCLQNALKADPNSIPARRGLVVLGALKPEAANLPPAHELEDLPVTLPSLGPGSGLGALTRRRNVERLTIGGLGLFTVIILLTSFLAVFKLGPFKPRPNTVVVTSTPPPTAALPTPVLTTLPAGACTLPADPNPATPLAAYLCLTQTPTAVPVATSSVRQEDVIGLARDYAQQNWEGMLARATRLLGDTSLQLDAPAYFYIAEAQRHTGNLTEALKTYRTTLQKDAGYAPAYWGKALAEIAQGDARAAQADFAGALTADPTFAPAYIDRASVAGANGDWAAAVADLEAGRQAAPANALLKGYLAYAYYRAGRGTEAAAAAEAALAQDPGLALGHFVRGLVGAADPAQADAEVSQAYQYLLLLDHPLSARWQAAILYDTAVIKAANAANAADAAALTLLSQALGLDDTLTDAYWLRAVLYARSGNAAAAEPDYATVIQRWQRDDAHAAQLVDAYRGLGLAQLALSRPADAQAAFQAALDRAPGDASANLGLGEALVALEQYDAAVAALTAALQAGPPTSLQAEALVWRARAYAALGQSAAAVADLHLVDSLLSDSHPLAATAAALATTIGPLPTSTPSPTATGPTPTLPPTVTPTRTANPSRTPTRTATP